MTEIIFPFSFLNEFHAVVTFALNDSPLMSCNFPFTLPPGLRLAAILSLLKKIVGVFKKCDSSCHCHCHCHCTQKIPGILFIVKVDKIFAVYLNTSLKVVNVVSNSATILSISSSKLFLCLCIYDYENLESLHFYYYYQRKENLGNKNLHEIRG